MTILEGFIAIGGVSVVGVLVKLSFQAGEILQIVRVLQTSQASTQIDLESLKHNLPLLQQRLDLHIAWHDKPGSG